MKGWFLQALLMFLTLLITPQDNEAVAGNRGKITNSLPFFMERAQLEINC